jgi:predicted metal-dependent hydrolase
MMFSLAKLMQYDLFDLFPPTLIEVPPQAELPKVLARHPHGVQLGAHFVPYQLRRTKRRTIGFMIAEEGLQVSAPHWVNVTEINSALISKQRWILTKLQELKNRPAPQIKTLANWKSGACLPYLGQQATLQVQYGAATTFDPATGSIILNLPSDAEPEKCKKHLHAWLMQQARRQFSERLPHFAEQLGVQYHSFTLTNARTLWGSCSPNGKIRLNWRLIHLTPHIIDYVIAHELAHLHEMNHSPRFWARVESVFPDYVAARGELRRLDMKTLPEL